MSNQVVVLESKRFVVRKSLIGKNTIVNVTFKNGTVAKYNHDAVYEVMKEKLSAMNCWEKYNSYTSSVSMPVATRHLAESIVSEMSIKDFEVVTK